MRAAHASRAHHAESSAKVRELSTLAGFLGLVVMTSGLHPEGQGFDPLRRQGLFFSPIPSHTHIDRFDTVILQTEPFY